MSFTDLRHSARSVQQLLIDTDTGVDDALAILYAFRSPRVRVEAITTVAGNVEVHQCTKNVETVLAVAGIRQRPVIAQGAHRPLRRNLVTAPEVHGNDGLGNIHARWLRGGHPISTDAVGCIRHFSDLLGDRLTIVALGPLTNIARAWKRYPESLQKVRRIVSMGGAFGVPGNTGPVAEFNYFVDPDAADTVLNSGLPVTVVPLDVTEQVRITKRELDDLAKISNTRTLSFVRRCTRPYMRYHLETLGFEGGYLHDPMAMAVAIDPSLARYALARIRVETLGRLTRGMTEGAFVHRTGNPGSEIAVRIDRGRFLRLFYDRVLKS